MIGAMQQHGASRDHSGGLSAPDLPAFSPALATEIASGASAPGSAANARSNTNSVINIGSTGFDLINHAIRMGGATTATASSGSPLSTGTTALPLDAESSSAAGSSSRHRNNELLLKARLLDRQCGVVPISTNGSPVRAAASASAGNIAALTEMVAVAAAQQQQQQQQQNLVSGGLVAALRRHRLVQSHQQQLNSTARNVAVELQLQQHLAFLEAAAASSGSGNPSVATGANEYNTTHPHQPTPRQQPPASTNSGGANTDAPTTEMHHQLQQPHKQQHQQSQDEQNARQLNPNAFQFPWKLHDMLDRSTNEGYEDVVSWVEAGEAFRVHVPDVFVDKVMPRFFKQTKYKSVSSSKEHNTEGWMDGWMDR